MSIDTTKSCVGPMRTELFADRNVYECVVWIHPEEEGGYSIDLVTLPGVVSQGETIEESIENIKEAFLGAVDVYRSNGVPIPWVNEVREPRPPQTIEKRILVDA